MTDSGKGVRNLNNRHLLAFHYTGLSGLPQTLVFPKFKRQQQDYVKMGQVSNHSGTGPPILSQSRCTEVIRYYFLAVPIPERIRLILKQEAASLKQKWAYRKWTHYSDYHITLHFFGGLGLQTLETVRKLSAETAARHDAFKLTLSGPGSFGTKEHPRVIFFGTETSIALAGLQSDFSRALAEAGFRTERRPYHPHITLAKNWLAGESGVWSTAESAAAGQSWTVDHVVLYSIRPGQTPEYHSEGIFSLKLP